MPEKQCTGSEREKKQIGHLRCQSGRIVHYCLPNQPAANAPNQSEIFHPGRSLLCGSQISIKVGMLSRMTSIYFWADCSRCRLKTDEEEDINTDRRFRRRSQ